MKYRICFTLALFLLFSFFHFLLFIPSFAAEAGPPAAEKKIVARVNGIGLTEDDLQGEVNKIIPGEIVHRSLTEERIKGIMKRALDNLIIGELIYQEAKAQGLKVKKKEIDMEIKELRERLKEPLEDIIEKNKLGMEDLRREIERSLLIKKAIEKMDRNIEAQVKKRLTDTYLREYYEKNKERFKEPERIRLREILLRVDPGGGQAQWDEVKAKATDILKRIKAGEDFARLATELSQDEYAKKGGDMGFVHKGSLIPEIEAEAERLKIGEVAGPIWTIYGYHIIKLEEKAPPIQRTFEETKERLRKSLKEEEFKDMRNGWIAGLKEKANIEYLIQGSNN